MSYSWTTAGEKEREGGIPVAEIERLRDEIKIGETLKFWSDRYYEVGLSGEIGDSRIVEGKVIAKYPHVFVLEDGHTYTWVDYILGRQKL